MKAMDLTSLVSNTMTKHTGKIQFVKQKILLNYLNN